MESYKGFKVGDKVEVTQQGIRIHYEIGEKGIVAEILTNGLLAVVFGGRREVVRPDNIKKLPKYAVGDVVRRNNKQMIKCTVTMVHPDFAYSVDDCGDLKFRETDLIPFDGFRVGDTVFTVKRGKGKIFAQNSHDDRQFGVRWEIDAPLYTFPKTTNLIPTEAKYKEALNKAGYAFKIDVAYVQEYVAKPKNEAAERQAEKIAKIKAAGEAFYQAAKNMAAAIGRTTDQIKFPSGGVVYQCPPIPEHLIVSREPIMKFQVAPSAKFKVGDAVYFDRKKWDVEDVATNECKIRISASAGSCTREFRAWTVVKESDLRLWVETKFTEGLSSFDDKWVKNDYYIDPSWTIMYIGKIVGKDTFVATGLSGSPALFRGIKGDDL